ncbi:adenylate kinase, partial [Coelomomyces lativittatus]
MGVLTWTPLPYPSPLPNTLVLGPPFPFEKAVFSIRHWFQTDDVSNRVCKWIGVLGGGDPVHPLSQVDPRPKEEHDGGNRERKRGPVNHLVTTYLKECFGWVHVYLDDDEMKLNSLIQEEGAMQKKQSHRAVIVEGGGESSLTTLKLVMEFERKFTHLDLVLYLDPPNSSTTTTTDTSGTSPDPLVPILEVYEQTRQLHRLSGQLTVDELCVQAKQVIKETFGWVPCVFPNVVYVLGGPGSGKGTQCAILVERLGFLHLSTGDLLRAEVQKKSEIGIKAEAIMQQGGMVPM